MSELTDEHLNVWSDIQLTNSSIDSPFFRPEFFDMVSMFRDDVFVAVLERCDGLGFFPFQKGPRKIGRPVGTPLSDFQGLIVPPGTQWDVAAVIRSCGLKSWHFDHLLISQTEFSKYQRSIVSSPYMDLSEGFDAYVLDRPHGGSTSFSNLKRAMRSAARDFGELRFDFDTKDRKVFEQLIAWKRTQYALTDSLDPFAFPWAINLLEQIRKCHTKAFDGVVSALYFGKRLAAAHFGMRSHGVLHYWFPAYDPNLAQYSPGMVCLLEIAKEAKLRGINRIDLGKGPESYKRRLMSGANSVAEGSVSVYRSGQLLAYARHRLESASAIPVLGAPLRALANMNRRIRRRYRYR